MNDSRSLLAGLRTGFGYDIHRFMPGVPLILGGLRLEHASGLSSHSDGDALCHAVTDALLTACGLSDIGTYFPPDDERFRGASSLELLRRTASVLQGELQLELLSLSVTVLAEAPKLAPHRAALRASLAEALSCDASRVSIAAGTNERFDAVGRGEALVCFAHLLALLPDAAGDLSARQAEADRVLHGLAAPQAAAPRVAAADDPLSGRAAERRASQPPLIGDDMDGLPERVVKFERAVASKLAPLPRAQRPEPGAELIVYTDGGSRGNPGPAATGWVVFDAFGLLVHERGSFLGSLTNNEAEYAALVEALDWVAGEFGGDMRIILRMDSELAVKQLKGEYKLRAENLRELYTRALARLTAFSHVQIEHIPRSQNARADALANLAMDRKSVVP